MDTVAIIKSFFEAENKRAWEQYQTFLHSDITWFLHRLEETTVIEGI